MCTTVPLDAFAKLQKATISFIMSACLSAWNKLGFNWTDFMKSDI
jgi:hypothetical protein